MKKTEEMKKTTIKITYEEALAECIKHYVDRGNSEELATLIVDRGEEFVIKLYYDIQEDKKKPKLATDINLFGRNQEEGDKNENTL